MAVTAFILGVLIGGLFVIEGIKHVFYFFTGWEKIRAYLHDGGYHTGWARPRPDGDWDLSIWLHGSYVGSGHLVNGYSPYREWLLEKEVKNG